MDGTEPRPPSVLFVTCLLSSDLAGGLVCCGKGGTREADAGVEPMRKVLKLTAGDSTMRGTGGRAGLCALDVRASRNQLRRYDFGAAGGKVVFMLSICTKAKRTCNALVVVVVVVETDLVPSLAPTPPRGS